MPDYGDKKGFQGSGKGQAATGGQKKGQGSGYNAPSPQYGGSLADTQNIKGTKYSPELAAAITASNKAAFDKKTQREFLNRMADLEASSGQKKGFKDAFKSIGQGITGLTSQLSPQRLIGSVIGNALLPGIGGLLGGIIGGTYADDDPSNNFFGNVGASLKKDITDTINFFRPQQVEQPMMTNIPMKRPTQMFPIQSVTDTTGMPFMDQIPDMFPDNFGVPTYTAEAAGFGIDSLMQPQQNETFTMPERNKFLDYGTMPRVTSAPLGTSSTPINAVDMFGNPITSGVSTFDPSVEVIDLGTADREIKPGTFSENLSFQDIVNALQNR
jgi:hypothetical protein